VRTPVNTVSRPRLTSDPVDLACYGRFPARSFDQTRDNHPGDTPASTPGRPPRAVPLDAGLGHEKGALWHACPRVASPNDTQQAADGRVIGTLTAMLGSRTTACRKR